MTTSHHIAKHLREVYFGGNWTVSCMKEHLSNVTWEQAIKKIDNFNTIAALVYHINYYVRTISSVLTGEALTASDKFSFDHPPVNSKKDWDKLLNEAWTDAQRLAGLIEHLPENILRETFVNEKYGIYYRNLHGVIEHTHYHLGQIVIVKKLVMADH